MKLSNPLILSVVLSLLSCAAWAQTKAEDKAKKDAERDVKLGKEYIVELEKGLKFSKDEAVIARVNKIGQELAKIANAQTVKASYGDDRQFHFEYVFKVIEDKDVNAFSVPGGFIYVHSALLDFVESDDELAAVMAHEVAHAAHRHMNALVRERSKLDLATLPLVLAALLGGSRDAGALIITQDLLKTALTNSWSQDAERDADETGFYYLRASGYSPTGMLTFLERLAFRENNSPNYNWGIERTHPATRRRVNDLLKLLRSNNLPIQRSKVTTSFRTVATKVGEDYEVKFGNRLIVSFKGASSNDRATLAVEQLNTFFDSNPQIFEVRVTGETVIGRGRALFSVTPIDGGQNALDAAVKNLKNAIFSLSLRTAGG